MLGLRRCDLRASLKVVLLGVSLRSGSSFQILGKEYRGSRLTCSVLDCGIKRSLAFLRVKFSFLS